MKSIFSILLIIISFSAFNQSNIILRIDQYIGEEPLEFNKEYTQSELDYPFSFNRLDYYISKIEITHDGGQITSVDNYWILVHAIENMDFELGNYDINQVEKISFGLGVEEEVNHLDPTQYDEGHPLAPQNPTMHWGWTSGYRFAALNGLAGTGLANVFEVHGLGDENYQTITLDVSDINEGENKVIIIKADYLNLLNGMDVSSGLFTHSAREEGQILLENFSESVFSAEGSLGNNDILDEFSFSIYPNPSSSGLFKLNFEEKENKVYSYQVLDIHGRIINQNSSIINKHIINLSNYNNGIYFVRILENEIVLTTEKLLLTN